MRLVLAAAALAVVTGCTHDRPAAGPAASPTRPRVIPSTSVTCEPSAGVTRCTANGELGAWDQVTVGADDRTLTVSFVGFCGAKPGDYAAATAEDDHQVTVYVYGARPFSNLCAGPQQARVKLGRPLGARRLVDGFDGKEHAAR